ncbi:U1 small nuclear ribonucleoprotein 70 kDa isoform X2 [Amborella trichopoda]|uniref:U1 small nuclear ribonucleoprotein 70 kDa isoform X2 n=1 Tax=Amborella trichopoda TaxID=13333 RepID=UPI0005D3453E|nr:U1 small nuclear ribonucleoprotein 70 kDa isoform X2 [Amborella trichopoda]|eukprot:XP_011629210.1 U1 small nuclear ribonucleoprotein 70 kDa isoform X2 [Amborella trichopoda]
MTIDDDNSIYVGGIPYDSTEESLRRVFDLYGAVVAVKIINDREVGGKCYGFVTFTNPRSAIDAINDMNGRTIGGRPVRVNEVRSRNRPNFHRENFNRDIGRDIDWDRDRDRDRDQDHDRDRYRDRNNGRLREQDRERERDYDRGHDYNRMKDNSLDRDREKDHDLDGNRTHDRDWDSEHGLDWDQDRDIERNIVKRDTERNKDHDRNRDKDKDKEHRPKNRLGFDERPMRERELSSNSSDYQDQVKEELDGAIKRHNELQREIDQMEEKFEEKQQLVLELQKNTQKLEESLAATKMLKLHRQAQLTKMQRCFLQVRGCTEKLKCYEQELQEYLYATEQTLVDADMVDVNDGENMEF